MKQTVLQTDASIKGLGTCLLQEEKPVYFASKALTDVTDWDTIAIEIESLAVAWAMGPRSINLILEPDEKPLEAVTATPYWLTIHTLRSNIPLQTDASIDQSV